MQINSCYLSKTFNKGTRTELQALKNINVSIHQGEFIAIIGHTGSGKTTFVEHLNGLSIPDEGWVEIIESVTKQLNDKELKKLNKKVIYHQKEQRIEIIDPKIIKKLKNKTFMNDSTLLGKADNYSAENWKEKYKIQKDVNKYAKIISIDYDKKTMLFEKKRVINNSKKKMRKINEIRRKVGVVFQFAEYQLFEETVLKDIMFGPLNMGVGKEKALELAKKYIVKVGMEEKFLDQSPFDLSGGQKRRVALAGILAMEPDVLILDEPTAGLDPAGAKDMLEIFRTLNNNGKTIVIITHDLDNVLEYSKRTLVFREGQLIRDDKTYEILKNIDFLIENELEPPKLIHIANEITKKGVKIGKISNLDDLANEIIKNS